MRVTSWNGQDERARRAERQKERRAHRVESTQKAKGGAGCYKAETKMIESERRGRELRYTYR